MSENHITRVPHKIKNDLNLTELGGHSEIKFLVLLPLHLQHLICRYRRSRSTASEN
jgi:hypothetical protein